MSKLGSTDELWNRYFYIRDTGHIPYVEKAVLCDDFFLGYQWSRQDLDKLTAEKRPALTINQTLGRLASVFGEQIRTRAEIGFKPAHGTSQEQADIITKVFKNISDARQLRWIRTNVFNDGAVGSRGFYDVRLDFSDNVLGDASATRMDPKSVLIDADASDYDPEKWNDVMTTRWYSPEDIGQIWGDEVAKRLRAINPGEFPYEGDMISRYRDRFRSNSPLWIPATAGWGDTESYVRFIRVLEWQRREACRCEFFVNPRTGDLRKVPFSWDRDRIANVVERFQLMVITRPSTRIKWMVAAANEMLYNEWSPYRHFTVVPYFPFFRNGRSTGLVEQLIGPQELLNKSLSEELHIVNTTSNSGWKVRSGKLKNMSIEELEERGAETGLVLELEDMDDAEKIQPNQVPQGIDRMVFHARSFFGDVSMVPDAMVGTDRPDVPAKARNAAARQGAFNLTMPLDNLERTDWMLARNVLDIVQEYYTEPRILRVTTDSFKGETEDVSVNQEDESTGEMLNDLTEGEYDIVVTTVPDQQTFEETQFDHAKELKDMGLPIPDEVLIENSHLARKHEVIKQMKEAGPPPMVQAQLDKMNKEIEKMTAEIDRIHADALNKRVNSADRAAMTRKTAAEADEVTARTEQTRAQTDKENEPELVEPDYKAMAKDVARRRAA